MESGLKLFASGGLLARAYPQSAVKLDDLRRDVRALLTELDEADRRAGAAERRNMTRYYVLDTDGLPTPLATRAPSDAALVEALEPFARAYERWADGGNLKGWQAERMKQSVDAHRYRVAFEALAAAKGQP